MIDLFIVIQARILYPAYEEELKDLLNERSLQEFQLPNILQGLIDLAREANGNKLMSCQYKKKFPENLITI